MLADEWLARLRQGSDILIEPRASLGFTLLMSLYALSPPRPRPYQEVARRLTQSERGADGESAGSSTVLLMTLEPLDLRR